MGLQDRLLERADAWVESQKMSKSQPGESKQRTWAGQGESVSPSQHRGRELTYAPLGNSRREHKVQKGERWGRVLERPSTSLEGIWTLFHMDHGTMEIKGFIQGHSMNRCT